jgi:hypothetical protein
MVGAKKTVSARIHVLAAVVWLAMFWQFHRVGGTITVSKRADVTS